MDREQQDGTECRGLKHCSEFNHFNMTQCLQKIEFRRKNKKEVNLHVYKDQQLKILHTELKNCKQFLLRQTDKQNQLQHGF